MLVAPAAFTSCFVESVERFLDGPAGPGLFPMLQILLGSRDAHLSYFLALPWSHTASEFRAAWVAMQQEVAGSGVSGPLDGAAWQAGQGRGSSAGLQRLITTQREQVARDRLHHRIMGLPHGDTRREAWLACDAFSSGWIGAWPSERDALSPAEFREVIATYLGRESPAVRALAGRSIPCCQRARRGGRVCDAYGQQLGLATLTDRAHGECHDYIAAGIFRDVLHSGMRGDTECRGVFASVLPVRILEHGDGERGRGELGIVPDARIHCRMHTASVDRCTAHQRYRGRTEQRGAQERHAADHLFDLKTVHGGGPCYQSARARDDGQFRVSGYSEFRIPNYYQTPKTRTVTPSHGTQPKSRPFSHTETANRVFKWYKKGHGHERHIGVPKLKTGGVVVHIGLIPYKSAGK